MKKLIVKVAAFVLATSALGAAGACPVKAGKISNGALAMPSGLQAECGIVYKMYAAQGKQASDNTVTWVELYKSSPKQSRQSIALLEKTYKAKGFVLYSHNKDSETEEFLYVNKRLKKLVGFQAIHMDNEFYLGIAGN